MKNITNMINNIGKPLEEQTIDVRLTHEELWAIRGLTQNPHPNYMNNEDLVRITESLFRDAVRITSAMRDEHEA